jgi:hypothetical protein
MRTQKESVTMDRSKLNAIYQQEFDAGRTHERELVWSMVWKEYNSGNIILLVKALDKLFGYLKAAEYQDL